MSNTSQGNVTYGYRPAKQDVVVSCSPAPNEVLTNSRIRVFCTKGGQSFTPSAVEWKRSLGNTEEPLQNNEGSCYECSPLDVGAIIDARIKYEDDGHHYETTRRFGPVRMDAELSQYERSNQQQTFRVKVLVDNFMLDLSLNFHDEAVILSSRDNLEYRMKLVSQPDLLLRQELRGVGWRMKGHSEALAGYFSTILKKPVKGKIDVLQLLFESRSKRDIFLLQLRNLTRRKSNHNSVSQAIYHKEEPPSTAFNRDRELNFSGTNFTGNRKNSDNNMGVPLVKRQRLPVEKDKLNIMKDKHTIQKVGILQQQQMYAQQPPSLNSTSNATPTVGANFKADCLNIFDEEDSPFLREFARDMSSDLPSKRQYALNLRQSFVELQQKNLTRSRKDLRLNNSSDQRNKQVRELKQQLEEARQHIHKLLTEMTELREETQSLRQVLGSNSSGKELLQLRQKIDYLQMENKRLENERAQIIADKIAMERKCQKEKQEKEAYRNRLTAMGVNLNTTVASKPEILVINNFKEAAERKDSRSPIQTSESIKIEPSRSTKDIKTRKESNNYRSIHFPTAGCAPDSPVQAKHTQSWHCQELQLEPATTSNPM